MLKLRIELILALLVGALCVAGYFEATSYRAQSAYLPTAVMVFGIVLSGIWAVQSILAQRTLLKAVDKDTAPEEPAETEALDLDYKKIAILLGSGLIYAYLIPVLGYFTSTVLFIPLASISLGYKRYRVLIASTLLFVFVLYILFVQVLRIPLFDELIIQVLGAN